MTRKKHKLLGGQNDFVEKTKKDWKSHYMLAWKCKSTLVVVCVCLHGKCTYRGSIWRRSMARSPEALLSC